MAPADIALLSAAPDLPAAGTTADDDNDDVDEEGSSDDGAASPAPEDDESAPEPAAVEKKKSRGVTSAADGGAKPKPDNKFDRMRQRRNQGFGHIPFLFPDLGDFLLHHCDVRVLVQNWTPQLTPRRLIRRPRPPAHGRGRRRR